MPPRRSLLALLMLLTVAVPVFGTAAAQTASARYRVVFDATWSAETHPQDFPGFPHFSPPIGGTHDTTTHFWRAGEPASLGMKRMAEWGSTSPLDAEILDAVAAGTAGEVIEAPWIPSSPGSTATEFTATLDHPLVTLVAMIAPSPDWFVGVDGASLLAGGAWLDTLTIPLFPFDAGTDDGTTYTSPDDPSQPPTPIFAVTGPPFTPGVELGTFTFIRLDAVAPVPGADALALRIAPNPFNPRTTIRFSPPAADLARVEIFDVAGRRVRLLAAGTFGPGPVSMAWDGLDDAGRPVPSGAYLVGVHGPGWGAAARAMLVR